MKINLGSQWEEFISLNVQSGRYLSASEVVREGLRLLQEQEQLRQLRFEQLRKEIHTGINQFDEGSFVEEDESGLKKQLSEIKRKGRQRLSRQKEKSKSGSA